MTVNEIIGNIEIQTEYKIQLFDEYGKFGEEGEVYDVTNKQEALELEVVYMFCQDNIITFEVVLDEYTELVPDGVARYQPIAEKFVPDCDGFVDSYTMYKDIATGKFVFIFGDPDYCVPEDGEFDWECETEAEAQEWFKNYKGSDDSSIA